jgi:phospholipid:diacylglycerol acyltransferase
MIATNYSFGIERDVDVLKKSDSDPTKWTNPLEVRYVPVCFLIHALGKIVVLSRLPHAPSMKIYCVYGHGKETEVS